MKWKNPFRKKPRIMDAAKHVVFPEVSKTGTQIAKLDHAAWVGTDAVHACKPDPSRMQFYIAYQDGDVWRVAFGLLSDDEACFLTAYEAYGDIAKAKPFNVDKFEEPRQDEGWLLQACLAIQASRKVFPFHPAAENYAYVALPEVDGSASVYWYPATTNPKIRLLGADGVVHVRGKEDIEVVQYHKNLMQQPRHDPQSMQAHTHMLIQEPVPLDVSYVMMGRPPEPSFVVCKNQTYLIWKDGSIVELPSQS
jgi:hypothetical protein